MVCPLTHVTSPGVQEEHGALGDDGAFVCDVADGGAWQSQPEDTEVSAEGSEVSMSMMIGYQPA